MRARTVNESQNFERGTNPKKAMGIGGLDLRKEYEERLDELKMSISGMEVQANEDWFNYIRKTLVGTQITAYMTQLMSINTKTGESSKKRHKGDISIEVQDVKPSPDFTEGLAKHMMTMPKLIVADMENNMYELVLNQKIHFE